MAGSEGLVENALALLGIRCDDRRDPQTDELLDWQTKELLERETDRRGITVFVRPELVIEIALDGVQSSTRYPGGVALRFARVKRYRPDKGAEEADTIDDLRALLPG